MPLRPPKPEAKRSVAFRRNDDYAVWDERGLTIRHGDRTRTSLLDDLPVSPRLFSHEQILRTVEMVNSGERSKNAAGLSGAIRIGRDAYFLVRWEDSKRRPWMEALVRVPLSGKALWPEVVGKFEGMSLAYKPIDDRLIPLGEDIAVVTRKPGAWGVATFNPKSKQFDFHGMGDDLLSYMSTGRKSAVYVEKTAFGPLQAGQVDLGTGQRSPVFEARANVRFLDTEHPLFVVSSTPGSARVHNVETGAEWSIPPNSGIARAGANLLVWTPADAPKTATLYRTDRWGVVARWGEKGEALGVGR
ncbi:hypothetical protein OP10G_0188 [Fimbriimonas ginsengisoli Gsoil 348]|uniref:Uncharacterized protein n=1 Tax=Fimbriimonas ginsengisoli Gsoil 348 TaxID=661478 RepID=A0A068NJA6_FIMGI|nr:hypothetical protein OP10G_0188 [Fimbriimonas ginsengisoli Gsoil 348]